MRLLVHVEGQTEEEFVYESLAPYLLNRGFSSVAARLLGNARLRSRRGGIRSWHVVRSDIGNHLKQDAGALATTIVDFYALPGGPDGWPGRDAAAAAPIHKRAGVVESAVRTDFEAYMDSNAGMSRLLPYVVMHEFEGLLFSDCVGFANGIGKPELSTRLEAVRASFENPEHINDSPHTAPSKRVIEIEPGYQKTLHGPLAATYIGIDTMRAECPGFNGWIAALLGAVD